MTPRSFNIFKLTSRLFKSQQFNLPTPFSLQIKPSNCQGSSTLAANHMRIDPYVRDEREYLPSLNIDAYKNRLASVKDDFDSFNIVEAQDSIDKIVSDLETAKSAYLAPINQISSIMLDAYHYMGICFSKGGLKDKEKAIIAFKKALEINPNHEISKIGLRNVELSFGIDAKGYPIAKKF